MAGCAGHPAGGDWDAQIQDALQACQGVLFVMTADSVQEHSPCRDEWGWALKYKKPVIPLRVDADADLPFRLSSRQYIDFSDDFNAGLARLRTYLASVGSPQWVLQDLRDQLAEAERELPRADPGRRPRVLQDIQELRRRAADQERLVADPQAAARLTDERIAAGLEQQRQPERPAVIEEERRHGVTARLPGTAGLEAGVNLPARIFLNYRREETRWAAGRLFDRLAHRFGKDQVFKDIDSIPLGDDFVDAITSAVGSCDVLLALIGDRWLTITDQDGQRRLDDDNNDFVRLEIEAALTRPVRVIPILVEGARMPRAADLPPSVAGLVRRQALTLNPDQEFEASVERLFRALDTTLDEVQNAPDFISGHLISPRDGMEVKRQEAVTGMITGLRPDDHTWIIVQRSERFWPQAELRPDPEGHFAERATFGRNDESDSGKEYILMLVVAKPAGSASLQTAKGDHMSRLPLDVRELDQVMVTRSRLSSSDSG